MATMAKWGSKTWAVSQKKVVALEGLAFSYSQVADNNTSTEEKKTTNERGTDLFPLSFTTVLHSGAGVDVRAEIESWKELVTKVNYFYLGGKKLGPKLQHRPECESQHGLEIPEQTGKHASAGSAKKDDHRRLLCKANREQVRNRPEDPELGKRAQP